MDLLPAWAEPVIAIAVFLIGGGTIGPWLAKRFRAGQHAELEALLSQKFSTIAEMNGFRGSVLARLDEMENRQKATIRLAELAVENADNALDAAKRIEVVQNSWQERIAEDVLSPLREIAREQQEMGRNMAAQTALLQRLTQEWDLRNH